MSDQEPTAKTSTPAPRPAQIITHALGFGVFAGLFVGALDLTGLLLDTDLLTSAVSPYGKLPLALAIALIFAVPILWGVAVAGVQGLFYTFRHWLESHHALLGRGLSLLLVLGYGAAWHSTLMQGDGIRAHAWFTGIYAVSLIVIEAVLVAFTLFSYTMKRADAVACALAALGLWFVSLRFLPLYTHFHLYAVLYATWLAGKVAWFVLRARASSPSWRAPGIVAPLLLVAIATVSFAGVKYAKYFKAMTYDLRLSKVVVQYSPVTPFLEDDSAAIKPLTPRTRTEAIARVDAGGVTGEEHEAQGRQKAKHVVIIVLESMRAESWSDPELAPEFASWKSYGTYFPHAIAQYPATPLAYGAMFLSQTPYVLVHSPYWAERTLVDHLQEQEVFDKVFLTRPDNPWFEQTAITNFILNPETKPSVHKNSSRGLSALRKELLAAQREPEKVGRMFGWVHAYEAHAPYKLHKNLRAPKAGEHKNLSAYLSEVRYVDQQLGRFMTWFYAQPISKETLLVVIGDHGEGMGDKVFGRTFWGHHAQVHRSVAHIPLYVSGPGIAKGRTVEQSVAGQIDVMPTVFSGIGEPLPGSFQAQGRSLFDVAGEHVEEGSYAPRRYSVEAFGLRGQKFFDFVSKTTQRGGEVLSDKPLAQIVAPGKNYSPKVSIQKGDYKLIYNRVTGVHYLYDLSKDPQETTDLSASQPEALAQMIEELELWRQEQQVIIERFNAR